MGTPTGPAHELRQERLLADLAEARAELLAAVDGLSPAQQRAATLVGGCSLAQAVAHLGYWAGWATQAIHEAEQGRLAQHDPDVDEDERNDIVARIAAQTDLDTVRAREAASVEALAERLRGLDPTLLDALWANGKDTLESLIDESGGSHYREHAAELRRLVEGGA